MCGGKKETDKKIQGPPLPEVSEEVVEPPAEEETPAPPPVEEPKGSVSATKSEFGTDTQMAANAQSIALMSTRPGHGAGYARKGPVAPVGGQSITTSVRDISLTLTTVRPEVRPRDTRSLAFAKPEIQAN